MPEIPMAATPAWHAERQPDRTAIVIPDGPTISYAELERRSTLVAHRMLDAGATPGSLVTILLPNGIDFFVAAFAIWKLGATPFPLSTRLTDVEREEMLAVAQPSLVVDAIDAIDDGGDDAAARGLPSVAPAGWKALGSGGSTGRPKVVVATTPATVDPTARPWGLQLDDVSLIPGPLHHQGPFVFSMASLFAGATLIVARRFDAAETLELVDRHRVTWSFLVPTMVHRLCRLPEEVRRAADVTSLRQVMCSGAPFPAWLKEEWIGWVGADVVLESYGGTEGIGSLVITGPEALEHPGSIGRATAEVRVLDGSGAEVERGVVGEISFPAADPPPFRYLGAEARRVGDWVSLGDLGYIGEDGYVYLSDRRTDLIVRGGANLYPAEIEGALEAHPAVRSAVVIGVPDDDLGQRVHAVVDIGDAAEPPPDAILDHLRRVLSPVKVPERLAFVREPLRDDAGKVRRLQVRERYLAEFQ